MLDHLLVYASVGGTEFKIWKASQVNDYAVNLKQLFQIVINI